MALVHAGPFLGVIPVHNGLSSQTTSSAHSVSQNKTSASLSYADGLIVDSYPRLVPGTSGGVISAGGTVNLPLFSYEEWSPSMDS